MGISLSLAPFDMNSYIVTILFSPHRFDRREERLDTRKSTKNVLIQSEIIKVNASTTWKNRSWLIIINEREDLPPGPRS